MGEGSEPHRPKHTYSVLYFQFAIFTLAFGYFAKKHFVFLVFCFRVSPFLLLRFFILSLLSLSFFLCALGKQKARALSLAAIQASSRQAA